MYPIKCCSPTPKPITAAWNFLDKFILVFKVLILIEHLISFIAKSLHTTKGPLP